MDKHLVILTTTGQRSGQPRSVKLYAFDDGASDLVVVGSKGGFPKDPVWAENLRAEPRATVQLGTMTSTVRAREVTEAERERLWPMVCDGFGYYASYQRKAGRQIPLFVLEPTQDDASG